MSIRRNFSLRLPTTTYLSVIFLLKITIVTVLFLSPLVERFPSFPLFFLSLCLLFCLDTKGLSSSLPGPFSPFVKSAKKYNTNEQIPKEISGTKTNNIKTRPTLSLLSGCVFRLFECSCCLTDSEHVGAWKSPAHRQVFCPIHEPPLRQTMLSHVLAKSVDDVTVALLWRGRINALTIRHTRSAILARVYMAASTTALMTRKPGSAAAEVRLVVCLSVTPATTKTSIVAVATVRVKVFGSDQHVS